MKNNNITLNLAYLYPQHLNIYGDSGNVLTLLFRCKQRGITLDISTIGIGEKIDPEKHDIYFIGGGQDIQQVSVSSDLQNKKTELVLAVENNSIFLAVCGGYQLLGKYYKMLDGSELKGIEVVDLYTVAGKTRMVGNILCEEIETKKTIVGFENHSGRTYLGTSCKPLAKVLRGCGNNGEDGFEGVRYKNIFGTYMHGSLLPKNPYIADKIIELALERKGLTMPLVEIEDAIENMAHKKAEKLKY